MYQRSHSMSRMGADEKVAESRTATENYRALRSARTRSLLRCEDERGMRMHNGEQALVIEEKCKALEEKSKALEEKCNVLVEENIRYIDKQDKTNAVKKWLDTYDINITYARGKELFDILTD